MYDLDIESFIDDRCPTVWNFGPPKPVDETGIQPKDVKPSFKATLTPLESEESRYDGRIKPIDGDLLRKLFRATMMEKQRAAEAERAVREQERAAYEQERAAYEQIERSKKAARTRNDGEASNDFAVPKARRGAALLNEQGDLKNSQQVEPTSKGKKSKKQKPVKAPSPDEAPADPDRPSSKASRDIQAEAPEADSKQEDKPKEVEKQDDEQGGQKQTKKQGKKQKKKQEQAQNEPAKEAKQAEALMSGGLPDDHEEAPSMQGEADELPAFVGAFEVRKECVKQQKARSATKSSRGKLQPTIESVPSSRPSKASFKLASATSGHQKIASPEIAPMTFEADKPQSFISWEEVGHGVVGETTAKSASKIASIRTGSKKSFNHDLGEVDGFWDPPQAERPVSEHRSPDVEWQAASHRSSKSRGLEAEHVHSHHSGSRQSGVSARSQRSVNGFAQDENAWPKQDQADSVSKPSPARSKARSTAEPADVVDPWTNSHDHTSPRRSATARSQPTFEEIGEGWVENKQQATSSRKSRRSHNINQAWDKPVSGNGSVSKAASQRTFEEVGKEWAQNAREAQPSRASRSGRSMPFSAIDDRTVSEAMAQSRSNKHIISRMTSKQSSAKTFEEVGRGWQGPDGEHSAAHSRGMSHRSRAITAYDEYHSPDEEQPDVPGSWRENASPSWHTVATESSVQSLRSSNPDTESDGSGRPVGAARPTFFAGKGWISPHPLSRSPTEWASQPQSRIILPSQAFPQGATLSYEEWKRLQDEGMRRNFSPTESHLTPNAKRVEHCHRFASWGEYASDGHHFDEGNTKLSASVNGPARYPPPYDDSQRAPDGEFIDPRDSMDLFRPTHPEDDETIQSGTWEEQGEAEYSDRSGRHSRVQTMSEWSHEHSGSKQAHDGSEVVSSRRSGDSDQPSSQRQGAHSRKSSRRTHKSSHHSKRHSNRDSTSTPSRQPSAGWGRFSLGTTVSRPSHRSSRHTNRHSDSSRGHSNSVDGRNATHSFAESRHSTSHGSGYKSHKGSHLRHEHSVSTQSEATERGWGQPANDSDASGHHSRRTTRQGSSHHTHNSRRHASARSTSNHVLPQSNTWKQSSHGSGSSSNERVMEVMEEGRNVWSDVPQYDGTASNRGYVERSDVSRTPTSQLYMGRYQGVWRTETDAERWE